MAAAQFHREAHRDIEQNLKVCRIGSVRIGDRIFHWLQTFSINSIAQALPHLPRRPVNFGTRAKRTEVWPTQSGWIGRTSPTFRQANRRASISRPIHSALNGSLTESNSAFHCTGDRRGGLICLLDSEGGFNWRMIGWTRSEEHTSELQSR